MKHILKKMKTNINKHIGIYRLTSPNGKVYIGQSIDLDKRLCKYKNLNCKVQTKIYRAILKYGWDNFKVDILWSTDDDTNITYILNQLEEDFVNLYDSVENGYNCRYGGGSKGKHSEESKEKMRIAATGKKASEETKEKMRKYSYSETNLNKLKIMSELNKGRTHSDKSKLKMREKSRMKPVLQYSKEGVFIKEWECAKDVDTQLGIAKSSIAKCAKNNAKSAGGFIWKYKYENYE